MNPALVPLLSPPVDDLRRRFAAAHGNRRALRDVQYEASKLMRQADDDVGPGGALSSASADLFDQLYTLTGEISDALARLDRLDNLDQQASTRPRAKADQMFNDGLGNFPVHAMIMRQIGKPLNGVDLGQAIEQSQELQRRSGRQFKGFAAPLAMLGQGLPPVPPRWIARADTISTNLPAAGPGGNLIATILDQSRYIDAYRIQPIIIQAGAQTISDLVGDLDIPRLKETGQVYWFTEGQDVQQTDLSFDRVHFHPRHCGSWSAYSLNMMLQSTPSIQAIIIDDLRQLLKVEIDRVVLAGSGRNGEPTGIIRNPLVTKIAATQYSYLNNIELRRQLSGRNVPLASCAFVGNSNIDAYSLSVMDGMSRPLGKSLVYANYPDFTSNACTAAAITGDSPLPAIADPLIFGAFSDVYVTFWQELDVSANEWADKFWFTGAVGIRAIMSLDANLRHPISFAWQDVQEGPETPSRLHFAAPPGPEPETRATAPAPTRTRPG